MMIKSGTIIREIATGEIYKVSYQVREYEKDTPQKHGSVIPKGSVVLSLSDTDIYYRRFTPGSIEIIGYSR